MGDIVAPTVAPDGVVDAAHRINDWLQSVDGSVGLDLDDLEVVLGWVIAPHLFNDPVSSDTEEC